MEFYLDTASHSLITIWKKYGVIRGVTTNPILIRREEGKHGYSVEKVLKAADPFPVCLQLNGAPYQRMVEAGREYSKLGDNVVVKVPVVDREGRLQLDVASSLVQEGIRVNVTACLSFGQAVLAASVGPAYISILCGRIADEGGRPDLTVERVREAISPDKPSGTKIIAASIRTPGDIMAICASHPDVVTASPEILSKLASHSYSMQTVREFEGTQ